MIKAYRYLITCIVVMSASMIMGQTEADHYVALKYGQIWTWGANNQGQCGVGHLDEVESPIQVTASNRDIDKVTIGAQHTLVLSNRYLYSWGDNTWGQLGFSHSSFPLIDTPKRGSWEDEDDDPIRFVDVAAGARHTLALDDNGRLWAWGDNRQGQLGDGSSGIDLREEPVLVQRSEGVFGRNLPEIVALSAGARHSLALDEDGIIWSWGGNETGQLGDPDAVGNRAQPLTVLSDQEPVVFVDISAGTDHSLALDSQGNLWGWGNNQKGQLAQDPNRLSQSDVPILIGPADIDIVTIAAGPQVTFLIDTAGIVYACGDNSQGLLGDSAFEMSAPFLPVPDVRDIQTLQVRNRSVIAVDPQGRGWHWGRIADNQTILPPTLSGDYPIVLLVSAAVGGTIVSTEDGTVLASRTAYSNDTSAVAASFNEHIALTAQATDGYGFTGWSGSAWDDGQVSGDSTEVLVTMDRDNSLQAEFEERAKIDVIAVCGPEGQILFVEQNITVEAGESQHVQLIDGLPVTIKAIPGDHYELDHWSLTIPCDCIADPHSATTTFTLTVEQADNVLQPIFKARKPGLIEPLKSVVTATLLKQNPDLDPATFDPNVLDMEQLTELHASGSGIEYLAGLEWADNLTFLDLSRNALTDLSVLADLANLSALDVSYNSLTHMASLNTGLQRLNIQHNPLESFEAFSRYGNLVYLLLNDTNDQIEDIPVSWLGKVGGIYSMSNLRFVDLRGNQGLSMSDTHVQRLQKEICLPNAGHVYVDP